MPLIAPPSDFALDSLTGFAKLSDDMSPKLGLAVMDNESHFIIATNKQLIS